MPATFEPIATTTVSGSVAASIDFTSIPTSYTDLRIVLTCTTSGGVNAINVRFNVDSGTNYSATYLSGNGTTTASARDTSVSNINNANVSTTSTTIPTLTTIDIFSYAGSTNKTALLTTSGDLNGSGVVYRTVGLWRSTAAINSVKLFAGARDFAIGTTATLFGIKAA